MFHVTGAPGLLSYTVIMFHVTHVVLTSLTLYSTVRMCPHAVMASCFLCCESAAGFMRDA